MEEFLKRGGKVLQLPEEIEWDIIPLEEKVKLVVIKIRNLFYSIWKQIGMNSNNNLTYGLYVYLSKRFGFYERLLKESNYE